MNKDAYLTGAMILGVPVFIGCWIYCIVEYGFLLGVGLGWLPSIITAIVVGLLWPVVLLVCAGAAILYLSAHKA